MSKPKAVVYAPRIDRIVRSASLAAALLSTSQLAAQATTSSRPLLSRSGGLSEEFISIGSIRELSDGRILVTERQEVRLVIGDPASGRTRTIGSRGDGPGEYRWLDQLVAGNGDTTFVPDRTARRWITAVGDRLQTTTSRLAVVSILRDAVLGIDSLGRVLTATPLSYRRSPGVPFTRSRTNAESLAVVLHTPERSRGAVRAETLASIRGWAAGQTNARRDTPPPSSIYQLENPLAAEEQAVLFPDGWIAVLHDRPYRVDWRDSGGRWVRGAPIPEERVTVDAELRRAIVRRQWPLVRPPFTDAELPPWPAMLPPFLNDALLRVLSGHVAVRRTFNPRRNLNEYDIVDRQGRVVDRVHVKASERIAAFGRQHLYIVTVDEDGLQRVERYAWALAAR